MTTFQKFAIILVGLSLCVSSPALFGQEPKEPAFRTPAGQDPFKSGDVVRSTKKDFVAAGFPTFQEREAEWRKKRDACRTKGLPDPPQTEKYLVSEIDSISGVTRTEKGTGVLIKMKNSPVLLSVREGSTFYNGSVVKIEKLPIQDLGSSNGNVRVVCNEVIINSNDPKEKKVEPREFYTKASGRQL